MSGELGSLSDFSILEQKEPIRILGLELAGAKNHKTALAALEYFPKEDKIFLIDLYEKIIPCADESNDHYLIELIHDLCSTKSQQKKIKLGVNVPLQLPPCLNCTLTKCKNTLGGCAKPESLWVRKYLNRIPHTGKKSSHLEHTGYTQRPVEAYLRHSVVSQLDPDLQFEIDETMGGNRAPLTARMVYLNRYLKKIETVEIWPKLLVAQLIQRYKMDRKLFRLYRDLDSGAEARHQLIEELMEHSEIFIYERDQRKISQNLAAFDAFLCAYGALLVSLKDTVQPPQGFPLKSGWVSFPPITDFHKKGARRRP